MEVDSTGKSHFENIGGEKAQKPPRPEISHSRAKHVAVEILPGSHKKKFMGFNQPTLRVEQKRFSGDTKLVVSCGDSQFKSAAHSVKHHLRAYGVDAVSYPEGNAKNQRVRQYMNLTEQYGGVIDQSPSHLFIARSYKPQPKQTIKANGDENAADGRLKRAANRLLDKIDVGKEYATLRKDRISSALLHAPHHFVTGVVEGKEGIVYKLNADGDLLMRDHAAGGEWTNTRDPALASDNINEVYSELARHADGNVYAVRNGKNIDRLEGAMSKKETKPLTTEILSCEDGIQSFTMKNDSSSQSILAAAGDLRRQIDGQVVVQASRVGFAHPTVVVNVAGCA